MCETFLGSMVSTGTMDLPFDIKELIAASLPGPDLARMAQVDPDFQGFFRNAVAPIFAQQLKSLFRIVAPLKRLFTLQPDTIDVMEDDGDHHIMSYILQREVEDGELFEDENDYIIWRTTQTCINSGKYINFTDLVDTYKLEARVALAEQEEFLDDYFEYNDLGMFLENM